LSVSLTAIALPGHLPPPRLLAMTMRTPLILLLLPSIVKVIEIFGLMTRAMMMAMITFVFGVGADHGWIAVFHGWIFGIYAMSLFGNRRLRSFHFVCCGFGCRRWSCLSVLIFFGLHFTSLYHWHIVSDSSS
jgi:hypothetical protein